jgi:ABC-type sugar transport system permease subunit
MSLETDTRTDDGTDTVGGIAVPERYKPWLFLLPSFVFYIPFLVLPILWVIVLGFFRFNGFNDLEYVGLSHYEQILTSATTYTAVQNTVVIAVLSVVVMTGGGLLFALALRGASDRFQSFFRTVFLLPMALMTVGVAFVWAFMYNPAYGVVNSLIAGFVERAPLWLGDPKFALGAIFVVALWQWTGLRTVIWMTGIDDIDESLFEAARMDGASRYQIFRYVTLPQLKPVALFLIVFTVITAFRVFGLFWVMTRGGPGHATEVMVTLIYKIAFFESSIGRAAALSTILFVMILVVTIVQFRVIGGVGDE